MKSPPTGTSKNYRDAFQKSRIGILNTEYYKVNALEILNPNLIPPSAHESAVRGMN